MQASTLERLNPRNNDNGPSGQSRAWHKGTVVSLGSFRSRRILSTNFSDPLSTTITVCFSSILLACSFVSGSLGLGPRQPASLAPRQNTPNGSGFHDGYYWSYWSTGGGGQAQYLNGPGGQYTMRWSNIGGDFIAGKGWKPGSNR
jgi:hypothetical protein